MKHKIGNVFDYEGGLLLHEDKDGHKQPTKLRARLQDINDDQVTLEVLEVGSGPKVWTGKTFQIELKDFDAKGDCAWSFTPVAMFTATTSADAVIQPS